MKGRPVQATPPPRNRAHAVVRGLIGMGEPRVLRLCKLVRSLDSKIRKA